MTKLGVYLMGGLGNQIFQYLFALKLQEHYGNCVTLYVDWFLANQVLNREINRPLLLQRIPSVKIPLSTLGLAAEEGITFSRVHHYEQGNGWDGFLSAADQNTLVMGYFQSIDALPDVVEVINFCAGLVSEGTTQRQPRTVAIHLRLGDYLKIQDTLPILPLEYYKLALAEQAPDSRFLVFAENANEAREYLYPLFADYHFEFQEPNDPVDDFRCLASMDAIIGANSTFSYLSGLAASHRGARVWLPAAEYWHGPRFSREIAWKRGLLAYGNFQLIT